MGACKQDDVVVIKIGLFMVLVLYGCLLYGVKHSIFVIGTVWISPDALLLGGRSLECPVYHGNFSPS